MISSSDGGSRCDISVPSIGLNRDKIGETPILHAHLTPSRRLSFGSNPTIKIVRTLPRLPQRRSASASAV